jgi:hypothetical protein
MYWFRESNPLGFIPFILAALTWTLGGWLITTHAFKMEKGQRLLVGFGLGLVIYLFLLNLIGGWFEIRLAYLLPAFFVLGIGLLTSIKSQQPFLDWQDLKLPPILLLFAGLFIYSLLLERGLGIYDDYHHLPAISAMGAGNLPPRYMLNAAYEYSYHYGFELLGGSLMQLGNLFSWSAFDLGKSLVWVYSLVLIAMLLKQYLEKTWKVILGVVLFLFLGGTRYLMMLLPSALLQSMDKAIAFSGVSQDLNLPFSKILFAQWQVGGGPPQPFIYGLTNSLNSPYILNHMGEWPLALIILALLWLLADKFTSHKAVPILAMLFAHLALTYESAYGLILVSLVLARLYERLILKKKSSRSFLLFGLAATLSLPFAILQGGSLFSIVKGVFEKAFGGQPTVIIHPTAESVFSIQWPPSISTAHFGALSIFSLPQLMVGLFEIGPIIFFTPLLIKWTRDKFQKGDWMIGILMISTWVGFIISMLVSYNFSERDITRFNKHALIFWNLFFIILLLQQAASWKRWVKGLVIFCSGLMLVTGIYNAAIQQSAIFRPVLSDGIDGLDAQISNEVWGKLQQKDLIFDPGSNDWRATAVTGLMTASSMNRENTPLWNQLSREPSLKGFIQNGFRYLYVDQGWWRGLSGAQRGSLSDACIKVIASASLDNDFQFRKILDMGQCPANP